jgi:hypothetical protein
VRWPASWDCGGLEPWGEVRWGEVGPRGRWHIRCTSRGGARGAVGVGSGRLRRGGPRTGGLRRRRTRRRRSGSALRGRGS